MHTWELDFARTLLKESGYETSRERHHLSIKPNSYIRETVQIPIENERIASAPLREFLDNPLILGGMRVRVQPKSLVEFD
jgi:hypothetical protein